MIDFATLQGLTIPEGVVTQITDESGRVIWAVANDKPIVLEVEKITSDTYAGETTYTGEQFILLDIYPKTNGTVKVTYGGLTKTITDTSGAESPNTQQVFFGTFNGVSDEVETPASGTLTIEGDYYGFSAGVFKKGKIGTAVAYGINGVVSFGKMTEIPNYAFSGSITAVGNLSKLTVVEIPSSIKKIGNYAFFGCKNLTSVILSNGLKELGEYVFENTALTRLVIPKSVETILSNPVAIVPNNNFIEVEEGNAFYKIDGNCLIEVATNELVSGFADSVIPTYITGIKCGAFAGQTGLTSITIPASVNLIEAGAFNDCTGLVEFIFLATTPPTLGNAAAVEGDGVSPIIVPAGCGEAYKAAEYWSEVADRIVEAS